MIVAVILALHCVAGALALPRLLRRAGWADRAPRRAIAMWLAACGSVPVSALLAVFAAAVPGPVVGHGLAGWLEICAAMFAGDARPDLARVLAALAVATSVVVWGSCAGGAVLAGARRERARHAEALSLLGRHDNRLGALVVDHDERLAYCVPGRRGQAVITTGALRSLAPEQVAAVLAHERAHLRGRHHLLLAAAETFARACPRVPLFAEARAEVARLVELLADDVAARRHPRAHLAAALVRLATGRAPAAALGAGGETALLRIRRMLSPQPPLGRRERLTGGLTVTLLLAGPATLAAAPGLSALLVHHCHAVLPF
ncbi:M56 family metallopeptidase [Nonomuraea sp. ATR24]|uniref:M56 family metallopeptidase n=1 Tax=Nonomuraea TaxID=83681 RepID=UPI001C5D6B54|nr:M56 family metallopeptidase [Nonomuraea ceibae]